MPARLNEFVPGNLYNFTTASSNSTRDVRLGRIAKPVELGFISASIRCKKGFKYGFEFE